MTQNNAAIPSLLADAVEKELTNVIKKKDWEMLEKENPNVEPEVLQDIIERHGVDRKPELVQDIIIRILQIPGYVDSIDAVFGWVVSNVIQVFIKKRIAQIAKDINPPIVFASEKEIVDAARGIAASLTLRSKVAQQNSKDARLMQNISTTLDFPQEIVTYIINMTDRIDTRNSPHGDIIEKFKYAAHIGEDHIENQITDAYFTHGRSLASDPIPILIHPTLTSTDDMEPITRALPFRDNAPFIHLKLQLTEVFIPPGKDSSLKLFQSATYYNKWKKVQIVIPCDIDSVDGLGYTLELLCESPTHLHSVNEIKFINYSDAIEATTDNCPSIGRIFSPDVLRSRERLVVNPRAFDTLQGSNIFDSLTTICIEDISVFWCNQPLSSWILLVSGIRTLRRLELKCTIGEQDEICYEKTDLDIPPCTSPHIRELRLSFFDTLDTMNLLNALVNWPTIEQLELYTYEPADRKYDQWYPGGCNADANLLATVRKKFPNVRRLYIGSINPDLLAMLLALLKDDPQLLPRLRELELCDPFKETRDHALIRDRGDDMDYDTRCFLHTWMGRGIYTPDAQSRFADAEFDLEEYALVAALIERVGTLEKLRMVFTEDYMRTYHRILQKCRTRPSAIMKEGLLAMDIQLEVTYIHESF